MMATLPDQFSFQDFVSYVCVGAQAVVVPRMFVFGIEDAINIKGLTIADGFMIAIALYILGFLIRAGTDVLVSMTQDREGNFYEPWTTLNRLVTLRLGQENRNVGYYKSVDDGFRNYKRVFSEVVRGSSESGVVDSHAIDHAARELAWRGPRAGYIQRVNQLRTFVRSSAAVCFVSAGFGVAVAGEACVDHPVVMVGLLLLAGCLWSYLADRFESTQLELMFQSGYLNLVSGSWKAKS